MDYSDYSTAPAATTSGSNPYALSHQNSARARAKAYMRQLISTGAAASSFASPPSTSSVSSSASSSSLPAVDRARTLPTTNMSQQNAMPARFSPVGGSNRLNPSPGLNEPYPSTSSLPRPSQQQRSQGYAQQGFATIDRSGGWGQAQSNTQQLSRPVNGIPKAPTGDITMMVPNRKLTTGSKYVTARQMKTQQTKPSQPLPSNGLSIQPSRRLNTDPKQGSMPLDSPNVDPVMSSINISLNSSAAMGNQMPYLRPTFGGAMQGRLYPDSARTSGSSMQPDSPHHVRNFQKTHPSVYTFPEEAEWEDMQEEDSFEPSSPVAARKESVATSAALSPTASTVVQDDTVSDDRELSFKQEISPPSSAPTSPMMGQRKRAFSNSRNAGTFESPVASLLGRLDQALTAALSRVPEADEVGGMDPASLTPISAVTPIHRGSADGMVFVENPKIDNEVYETHSKNLDSMLSSQSPLTEVAAAAEETFIELSSPPVPPLRSASLRGRADGSRKVRTRASRTILRKRSTREKLLENAAVKRSSRRTSVDSNSINGRESEQRSSFTPSKESDRFRIPSNDGPDIGQYRLDLDFDTIRAFVDGRGSVPDAPVDELQPQAADESHESRSSLPAAAPLVSWRDSYNAHLASVERAISAVEEEHPRQSSKVTLQAAEKTLMNGGVGFAEKRKVRQSVVRRLDGVLLEAMEATGDFFDVDDWEDEEWEDVEDEPTDPAFDETTEDLPSSIFGDTSTAQDVDDDDSVWIDDQEIESWKRKRRTAEAKLKASLQPRPEVDNDSSSVTGALAPPTPDFLEEQAIPRRQLNSEDLSKIWRISAGNRSSGGGEKTGGVFIRHSTISSNKSAGEQTPVDFHGPLSPLQPIIPKSSPARRTPTSPAPEFLSDLLYRPDSGGQTETFTEVSREATTLPSMSRSLSSPASSSSTYPSIAPPPVPPLPNEYQSPFSNDGMPNGTFGSLARRYHKAAPESTMKPLNRPRRGPTISIDSTATSGDVGASVWADFVAPGAPRSNPLRSAPVQTNGLGYHPPQTATLNRGYAGPASTLGRTRGSVDFNGSAGLGSEYVGLRRGSIEDSRNEGNGKTSLFSKFKFQMGGRRQVNETVTLPRNVGHTGFLEESGDAWDEGSHVARQDGKGGENMVSMSRSKSSGGFGKKLFGKR